MEQISTPAISTPGNKFKFSIKILNRIIVLIAIISGLTYLLCVNDLAIKGFKINELKKQLNTLSEENTKQELEIMSLKSYTKISQRAKELNLVPAGKAIYVNTDTGLAVR